MTRRRTADPWRDTDVIDARAPRFNQLVVGARRARRRALRLAAGVGADGGAAADRLDPGPPLLPHLRRLLRPDPAALRRGAARGLAAAAAGQRDGLRLPRRRTPGLVAGIADRWNRRSAAMVAGLALLAAGSGFCTGCELYKLGARLRGISPRHHSHIEPADLGALDGHARTLVEFTHPLCSECREWERRLAAATRAAGRPRRSRPARPRPQVRDRGRAHGRRGRRRRHGARAARALIPVTT